MQYLHRVFEFTNFYTEFLEEQPFIIYDRSVEALKAVALYDEAQQNKNRKRAAWQQPTASSLKGMGKMDVIKSLRSTSSAVAATADGAIAPTSEGAAADGGIDGDGAQSSTFVTPPPPIVPQFHGLRLLRTIVAERDAAYLTDKGGATLLSSVAVKIQEQQARVNAQLAKAAAAEKANVMSSVHRAEEDDRMLRAAMAAAAAAAAAALEAEQQANSSGGGGKQSASKQAAPITATANSGGVAAAAAAGRASPLPLPLPPPPMPAPPIDPKPLFGTVATALDRRDDKLLVSLAVSGTRGPFARAQRIYQRKMEAYNNSNSAVNRAAMMAKGGGTANGGKKQKAATATAAGAANAANKTGKPKAGNVPSSSFGGKDADAAAAESAPPFDHRTFAASLKANPVPLVANYSPPMREKAAARVLYGHVMASLFELGQLDVPLTNPTITAATNMTKATSSPSSASVLSHKRLVSALNQLATLSPATYKVKLMMMMPNPSPPPLTTNDDANAAVDNDGVRDRSDANDAVSVCKSIPHVRLNEVWFILEQCLLSTRLSLAGPHHSSYSSLNASPSSADAGGAMMEATASSDPSLGSGGGGLQWATSSVVNSAIRREYTVLSNKWPSEVIAKAKRDASSSPSLSPSSPSPLLITTAHVAAFDGTPLKSFEVAGEKELEAMLRLFDEADEQQQRGEKEEGSGENHASANSDANNTNKNTKSANSKKDDPFACTSHYTKPIRLSYLSAHLGAVEELFGFFTAVTPSVVLEHLPIARCADEIQYRRVFLNVVEIAMRYIVHPAMQTAWPDFHNPWLEEEGRTSVMTMKMAGTNTETEKKQKNGDNSIANEEEEDTKGAPSSSSALLLRDDTTPRELLDVLTEAIAFLGGSRGFNADQQCNTVNHKGGGGGGSSGYGGGSSVYDTAFFDYKMAIAQFHQHQLELLQQQQAASNASKGVVTTPTKSNNICPIQKISLPLAVQQQLSLGGRQGNGKHKQKEVQPPFGAVIEAAAIALERLAYYQQPQQAVTRDEKEEVPTTATTTPSHWGNRLLFLRYLGQQVRLMAGSYRSFIMMQRLGVGIRYSAAGLKAGGGDDDDATTAGNASAGRSSHQPSPSTASLSITAHPSSSLSSSSAGPTITRRIDTLTGRALNAWSLLLGLGDEPLMERVLQGMASGAAKKAKVAVQLKALAEDGGGGKGPTSPSSVFAAAPSPCPFSLIQPLLPPTFFDNDDDGDQQQSPHDPLRLSLHMANTLAHYFSRKETVLGRWEGLIRGIKKERDDAVAAALKAEAEEEQKRRLAASMGAIGGGKGFALLSGGGEGTGANDDSATPTLTQASAGSGDAPAPQFQLFPTLVNACMNMLKRNPTLAKQFAAQQASNASSSSVGAVGGGTTVMTASSAPAAASSAPAAGSNNAAISAANALAALPPWVVTGPSDTAADSGSIGLAIAYAASVLSGGGVEGEKGGAFSRAAPFVLPPVVITVLTQQVAGTDPSSSASSPSAVAANSSAKELFALIELVASDLPLLTVSTPADGTASAPTAAAASSDNTSSPSSSTSPFASFPTAGVTLNGTACTRDAYFDAVSGLATLADCMEEMVLLMGGARWWGEEKEKEKDNGAAAKGAGGAPPSTSVAAGQQQQQRPSIFVAIKESNKGNVPAAAAAVGAAASSAQQQPLPPRIDPIIFRNKGPLLIADPLPPPRRHIVSAQLVHSYRIDRISSYYLMTQMLPRHALLLEGVGWGGDCNSSSSTTLTIGGEGGLPKAMAPFFRPVSLGGPAAGHLAALNSLVAAHSEAIAMAANNGNNNSGNSVIGGGRGGKGGGGKQPSSLLQGGGGNTADASTSIVPRDSPNAFPLWRDADSIFYEDDAAEKQSKKTTNSTKGDEEEKALLYAKFAKLLGIPVPSALVAASPTAAASQHHASAAAAPPSTSSSPAAAALGESQHVSGGQAPATLSSPSPSAPSPYAIKLSVAAKAASAVGPAANLAAEGGARAVLSHLCDLVLKMKGLVDIFSQHKARVAAGLASPAALKTVLNAARAAMEAMGREVTLLLVRLWRGHMLQRVLMVKEQE